MSEINLESLLEKATTSINELIQKLIEQGVLLKPDVPLNTNFARATVPGDFIIEISFDEKFHDIDSLAIRTCLDDLTSQTLNILGAENFTLHEGVVEPSDLAPYISAELYFRHK